MFMGVFVFLTSVFIPFNFGFCEGFLHLICVKFVLGVCKVCMYGLVDFCYVSR